MALFQWIVDYKTFSGMRPAESGKYTYMRFFLVDGIIKHVKQLHSRFRGLRLGRRGGVERLLVLPVGLSSDIRDKTREMVIAFLKILSGNSKCLVSRRLLYAALKRRPNFVMQ